MFVIDASVAIKWFVEEEGSKDAENILINIRDNPTLYFVPELFFVEMLNVLSKYQNSELQLKNDIKRLEGLGLSRIALGHELLQRCAHFVSRYKVSAYDGLYIATAESVEGKWLTADLKTHKKIEKLKLSEVV